MVSDFILWLDLETTGNGPDDDIIELGAVLTDQDYNILTSFERVYRTKRAISVIAPRVLKMHYDNGLWLKTIEATSYAVDAESEILAWLGKAGALKGGAASLPLAGSGTSHFDRRYIERDWPSLARRLTYWNLDIGVVRRFMRNWMTEQEFKVAFTLRPGEADPKHHRALSDVMLHIEEARLYRGFIQGY
jgi:oligoribonuclease